MSIEVNLVFKYNFSTIFIKIVQVFAEESQVKPSQTILKVIGPDDNEFKSYNSYNILSLPLNFKSDLMIDVWPGK